MRRRSLYLAMLLVLAVTEERAVAQTPLPGPNPGVVIATSASAQAPAALGPPVAAPAPVSRPIIATANPLPRTLPQVGQTPAAFPLVNENVRLLPPPATPALTTVSPSGIQLVSLHPAAPMPPSLVLVERGPGTARVGETVAFQFMVTNNGTGPATHVLVHDHLPPGLRHSQGNDIQADLGTLAPGESRIFTLQAAAVQAGRQVNEAVVTAAEGAEALAKVSLQVSEPQAVALARDVRTIDPSLATSAALRLDVADLDDPVEVGAETTYEIRVHNQGIGAGTGVRIVTVVPEGMVPLGAEGPTVHRIEGQQVIFGPVPRLEGLSETRFRVRVRAGKRGDWRFKVYLSCDQLQQPVYGEESTQVYEGR